MIRYLLCLPLLGLAPALDFLGPYLGGAGMISENLGFIASAMALFIVPFAAAALCLALSKAKGPTRVFLFVGALVVQGILLFGVVPTGATSEMIGIAHRLKREFQADDLRRCAQIIRQKFRDGTLATHPRGKDDHFIVNVPALVVPDTELSPSLRGRFQRVYIQKVTGSAVEQVLFALGPERGILCDDRTNVCGYFACSIANGVEAYRYQRF